MQSVSVSQIFFFPAFIVFSFLILHLFLLFLHFLFLLSLFFSFFPSPFLFFLIYIFIVFLFLILHLFLFFLHFFFHLSPLVFLLFPRLSLFPLFLISLPAFLSCPSPDQSPPIFSPSWRRPGNRKEGGKDTRNFGASVQANEPPGPRAPATIG